MIQPRRDFDMRVQELNRYFDFAGNILEIESHKAHDFLLPNQKKCEIDSELQRVIKATCYILLYNFLEFSVRSFILLIYDTINDENLAYDKASDCIQDVWLRDRGEALKNQSTSVKKLQQALKRNLEYDPSEVIIFLNPDKVPISANLKGEVVENLLRKYGIFGKVRRSREEINSVLDHITKIRNDLAHGNISFKKAGEYITIEDIQKYKKVLIEYMEDILLMVEDYIHQRKYGR